MFCHVGVYAEYVSSEWRLGKNGAKNMTKIVM